MSLLDALRYRLRVLRDPGAYDRDLDEEFRFHLSLEAMQQQHAARGSLSARECTPAKRPSRRWLNLS